MKSTTPKVLHTLAGRSLLGHAVAAAQGIDPERIAVVVRHQRDVVAAQVQAIESSIMVVDQDEVYGTGRAVQCALSVLDAAAHAHAVATAGVPEGSEGRGVGDGVVGSIVVIAGDVPLLDAGTLGELVAAHAADGNAVTVLTTEVEDPTGYGRIVRDGSTGEVLAIVEHPDATPEQREIREINSSVFVFDAAALRHGLSVVDRNNSQGEMYLTDVLEVARAQGRSVRALRTDDPMTVEGVNDRSQLAVLGAEMNRRILNDWMLAGVTIVDPATTWIDVDVELGRDVTVLPGTQLLRATIIREGATIGPDTTLTDTEVGAGATVCRTQAQLSVIGDNATVGPFSYLRPGTVLGSGGKIGGFVETKNATIGDGSKVPHLSYVGDATIGEHTNIGAATIFVNYDGVDKHHSTVGSFSRTGADNLFVAPVHLGDGVYTGAGSVIRTDVPSGALAVSAGTQRNIEGWVERRRPGTDAARAAERVRSESGTPGGGLGAQALAERAQANHQATLPVPSPPTASPNQAAPQPGTDGSTEGHSN
jgi:bifunctional UDP-N-acetylglucosamine pyrophosphorylase / glucosamine-1-phosphate N-acetyltransferase